ncbi:MAG: PAS domain-containing protein [Candidatus Gracilibacteria bacterium]
MPEKKFKKVSNIASLGVCATGTGTIYRRLVENMNEIVWLGDSEERTVYVNPKFCKLLGYTPQEVIGKTAYDFWDKESVERVRHINETDRSEGRSSSYEGDLIKKTGEKIPVLVSGTPLPDGGTIAIMTDLTEIKKKEQKERILMGAIQYATDAIIVFDASGKIISWNKGSKIVFGYKQEEMLGQPLDRLFKKTDLENIKNYAKTLYNIELEGIHKNKAPMRLSATLTPLFSHEEGEETFYLLIARDITSQVKFEEDLTLKYQKMKEAYKKIGVLRRQMDYIMDGISFFNENRDPQAIGHFFVSAVMMLTHVDACILRMYNKKKGTMDLLSCFGVVEDWRGKAQVKYKGSLAEKAFLKGSPLKVIDVVQEIKFQSKYLAKKNNLCSLLMVPLQFKGKFVGSLSLYVGPDKKQEIFENDFIEKYAEVIGMVMGMMFGSEREGRE